MQTHVYPSVYVLYTSTYRITVYITATQLIYFFQCTLQNALFIVLQVSLQECFSTTL